MKHVHQLSRRQALRNIAAGTIGLGTSSFNWDFKSPMMTKAIPSSGELVGVVGLGTWKTFDVGQSTTARKPLKEVLKLLSTAGGSVIDSSPMYGSSESVVGELTRELNLHNKIFYATKVWTTGRDQGISQMKQSMNRMRSPQMHLMQIHNLVDWKTHLKTLYDWKEQGIIKYIGITHYIDSTHDQLAKIIETEKIDFVQVNYSLAERNAEHSLLEVAKDHGVAVITNRPYAGGSLFRKVRGKTLPDWANDFDCQSWGQFFLKYLIAHPAVTCVIPGTSKPHHMRDNTGAGYGRLPSAEERIKMKNLIVSL